MNVRAAPRDQVNLYKSAYPDLDTEVIESVCIQLQSTPDVIAERLQDMAGPPRVKPATMAAGTSSSSASSSSSSSSSAAGSGRGTTYFTHDPYNQAYTLQYVRADESSQAVPDVNRAPLPARGMQAQPPRRESLPPHLQPSPLPRQAYLPPHRRGKQAPPLPRLETVNTSDHRKNDSECCVCLDKPRSVVLLPCKHLCICPSCSEAVTDCPMCRTRIADRMSVFV